MRLLSIEAEVEGKSFETPMVYLTERIGFNECLTIRIYLGTV